MSRMIAKVLMLTTMMLFAVPAVADNFILFSSVFVSSTFSVANNQQLFSSALATFQNWQSMPVLSPFYQSGNIVNNSVTVVFGFDPYATSDHEAQTLRAVDLYNYVLAHPDATDLKAVLSTSKYNGMLMTSIVTYNSTSPPVPTPAPAGVMSFIDEHYPAIIVGCVVFVIGVVALVVCLCMRRRAQNDERLLSTMEAMLDAEVNAKRDRPMVQVKRVSEPSPVPRKGDASMPAPRQQV